MPTRPLSQTDGSSPASATASRAAMTASWAKRSISRWAATPSTSRGSQSVTE